MSKPKRFITALNRFTGEVETHCITEWYKITGRARSTIIGRLEVMSPEEALFGELDPHGAKARRQAPPSSPPPVRWTLNDPLYRLAMCTPWR